MKGTQNSSGIKSIWSWLIFCCLKKHECPVVGWVSILVSMQKDGSSQTSKSHLAEERGAQCFLVLTLKPRASCVPTVHHASPLTCSLYQKQRWGIPQSRSKRKKDTHTKKGYIYGAARSPGLPNSLSVCFIFKERKRRKSAAQGSVLPTVAAGQVQCSKCPFHLPGSLHLTGNLHLPGNSI